ncbi:lipid droplet-regulating VLDL assembly factor AUP1-like [Adelges cooleyi]|uniref:lipid droplet-regulating VLDL assembly factor AUP1-like n=1 Tax=Adelges cooleyi TaxID=133065 RepID=UPI00217F3DE9|nr:lipid droplet-regulating VLDL assembly factor AUP1-like [Adelges cooleyi]
MTSDITVENLVVKSRFPKSIDKKIGIIVYFPLGFIIAILRAFISLNVLFLTVLLTRYPWIRRPLLRIMCGVIGLIVVENDKSVPKKNQMIVSNHLSMFDHVALHLAIGSYTPTRKFADPIASFFGLVSMLHHENVTSATAFLKQFISNGRSLVLFPEGATTNGKSALLRFSTFPTVISDVLQPVVIKTRRPSFADVNLSVLGSSWFTEIFWFFFVPYTVFEYKLLRVIERSEDESNEAMITRVETAISHELNISTSNLNKNDKAEYEKKYLLELSDNKRKQNKNVALNDFEEDPEILRMAVQVSDVLPYVPNNVIIANLKRTKSVDITITNILDGTVKYTPLVKSSRELKPAVKSSEPNNFGVASFVERKAKLIDEARKRYINKHNLHHLVQ